MSEQYQVPEYNEAFAKLASEVSVPVFMEKLASHGYNPANQEAADAFIKMALKIDSTIAKVMAACQQSQPDYTKMAADALMGEQQATEQYNEAFTKYSEDYLNLEGVREAALAYVSHTING